MGIRTINIFGKQVNPIDIRYFDTPDDFYDNRVTMSSLKSCVSSVTGGKRNGLR